MKDIYIYIYLALSLRKSNPVLSHRFTQMSGQGRWKDEVKNASFDGLSDKKIGLLVGSFLTGSDGGVNIVG